MTRKKFIVGTWITALVLAGIFYAAYRIFMNSMPEAFRTTISVQPVRTPAATLEFKTESVNQSTGEPKIVWSPTGLTSALVASATVEFQKSDAIVVLKFTPAGRDLFAQLTKDNIGKHIGIFVDNQLVSAPIVQTTITDGTAIIVGNFTPQEAAALVAKLNAGSTPIR